MYILNYNPGYQVKSSQMFLKKTSALQSWVLKIIMASLGAVV